MTERRSTLIFIVFFVSNLALSGYLVSRSFASQGRQIQTQSYIKCILLLRYDSPQLTPASPRQDVEAALDRCAEYVRK